MIIKYGREMVTSPVQVLKNLFLYRHILLQMVAREIKGRFAGSMGGLLWNFVHPVLMIIVYLFVFVYVFKLRVNTGGSGASAVYLMAGLFPWIILAEGLSRGTSSLIENATLIQKTSFPTEILIAKATLAPLLSYGIAVVLLMLYSGVAQGHLLIFPVLPLIMVLQLFFTLGFSFLCSAFTVFFRDMMQLVHILVSFWIYVTPVLYPVSMLPEWARNIMYINPLFPFISIYQSLFLSGDIGQAHMLVLAFAWALCLFTAGAFVFNKLKYEFADWL